jgi:hypothetical protein
MAADSGDPLPVPEPTRAQMRNDPKRLAQAAPMLAAAAALAGAVVVLQLWGSDLRVPFAAGVDAPNVLSYMQVTLTHLWPLHNDLLGAPYGQSLADYPLCDPAQIVLTKLIGLFTGDVALVTNLFFLLTFPLTAAAATWVFERLGLSRPVAIACAVLFALAPYHFFRGEGHLLIAAYYAVPFSCFLVLRAFAGDMPPTRIVVVLSLIVGLAFTYYVAFTALLLAPAALVALARGRRDTARSAGLALAIVLGVGALSHAPTLVYHLKHGSAPAVAALHAPDQSERFGLKLPRLLLPVPGHRIGPLADLTGHFESRSPSQLEEGPPQALGLAAAVGFAWLLWTGLTAALGRRREDDPVFDAAAAATALSVIVGIVGGAGLLAAYFVSGWVRSWDRISIFLAFFALVALGRLLDRGMAALRARGVRGPALTALLVALTIVAVADQTSGRMVPEYADAATQWHGDAAFAGQIEARLPGKALILDLPYYPFPEITYDQARPSLHSDRLRWTFGALSGRPADWTASLSGLSTEIAATAAAAAGAQGIYVDRGAYPEAGGAVARDLRTLLRAEPLTSEHGAEFFDLRPFAAAVARGLGPERLADLRERTLHPIRVVPAGNWSAPQVERGDGGHDSFRLVYGRESHIDLVNPLSSPRQAELRFDVRRQSPPFGLVEVTGPDGGVQRLKAKQSEAGVTVKAMLRPGRNRVRIETFGLYPPGVYPTFGLGDIAVADPVALGHVSAALSPAG